MRIKESDQKDRDELSLSVSFILIEMSGKPKTKPPRKKLRSRISFTKTEKALYPRIWATWYRMFTNCYGTPSPKHAKYQDRGIKVCKLWHTFSNFILSTALSGNYQDKFFLNRIDKDKDYFPENCEWGARKSGTNTKKENTYAIINGVVHVDVSTKSHPFATMYIDEDDWYSLHEKYDLGRICAFSPTKVKYAICSINNRPQRVHRLIMPNVKYIDHINGDGLDNRRINIREVTSRQNSQNRHAPSSSIYPGVSWNIRQHKWVTSIRINGHPESRGSFNKEEDAAQAYRDAVVANGEVMVDQI